MSNLSFTNVSKVGLSEFFYQYVCAPLESTQVGSEINRNVVREKKEESFTEADV